VSSEERRARQRRKLEKMVQEGKVEVIIPAVGDESIVLTLRGDLDEMTDQVEKLVDALAGLGEICTAEELKEVVHEAKEEARHRPVRP